MLLLFARSFYWGLRNRIKSLTFFGEVKLAFFGILCILFSIFLYALFYRLIYYLDNIAIIGPQLTGKFLSLALLTIWWMIVLSSLNTTYGNFYFSADLDWLLSRPIPLKSFLNLKIVENVLNASTFSAFAMAPILVAFAHVRGGGLFFLVFSMGTAVLFFASAALAGTLFVLCLNYIFPASRLRSFFSVLIVSFGTSVYVLIRLLSPEKLVRPDSLEAVAQYLNYLETPAAYWLPSGWYYFGILGAMAGKVDYASVSLLLVVCAAAYFAVIITAEKFYLESLSNKEFLKIIKKPAVKDISVTKAIAGTDVKLFFREPQRWTQLILLAGIFLVYLVSIYKIPADTFYLYTLVSFFNIALTGFIVAALALRFVFPIFSLEAKTWWAMASSPLALNEIIFSKFLLHGGFVIAVGFVISLAAGIILKLDFYLFSLSLISLTAMSFTISAIALYLGAKFPKTKFSNTAEIEGSVGGIFYIMASLFCLALNLSMIAVPFQIYYKYKLGMDYEKTVAFGMLAFYVLINILGTAYFFRKTKDVIYEP